MKKNIFSILLIASFSHIFCASSETVHQNFLYSLIASFSNIFCASNPTVHQERPSQTVLEEKSTQTVSQKRPSETVPALLVSKPNISKELFWEAGYSFDPDLNTIEQFCRQQNERGGFDDEANGLLVGAIYTTTNDSGRQSQKLVEKLKVYKKSGIDLKNLKNKDGVYVLHRLTAHSLSLDALRFVLDQEPDIDINRRIMDRFIVNYEGSILWGGYMKKSGYTPLHLAVVSYESGWIQNHLEKIKLLCERGADVRLRGKDGKTPLDLARELPSNIPDRVEIIKTLEFAMLKEQSPVDTPLTRASVEVRDFIRASAAWVPSSTNNLTLCQRLRLDASESKQEKSRKL